MTDERHDHIGAGAAETKSTLDPTATMIATPARTGIASWSTQKKVIVGCVVAILVSVAVLGACGAFVYTIFRVTSPIVTGSPVAERIDQGE